MLLQVVGLTTAIGVIRGTGSEAFAVGLVFSIVVRQLADLCSACCDLSCLSACA